MQRDGRDFKVVVAPDGEGLVSHAGSALLAQVAEKTGLTGMLSSGLSDLKQRRSGHDQGRVIRDLAVMLADGGDCLGDIDALGDQEPLFGMSPRRRRRSGSSIGSRATQRAWSACAPLTRERAGACGSSSAPQSI